MRVFVRVDIVLAIGPVAGALGTISQPLGILADGIERRHHIALLAGLIVLVAAVGLHQVWKRYGSREFEDAAAIPSEQVAARNAELERLVAFGRALGAALEPAGTRKVFKQFIPQFAGERPVWMLTRGQDGWESLLQVHAAADRSVEAIQATADATQKSLTAEPDSGDAVLIGSDLCFPLVAGNTTVGVVGIRNTPALSPSERHALSAVSALLAIAVRNGQLMTPTRQGGIRDSLTGCFNRAYGLEALAAELRRSKRSMRPVALLMLDINEFKSVNDHYGHLAGDAILSAVGTRLSSMLRGTDVKCRYGADEFLLILPDTNLQGGEQVAAALVEALSEIQVPIGGTTVSPSVSVGVSVVSSGQTDALAVVASASEALCRADCGRRNQHAAIHFQTTL